MLRAHLWTPAAGVTLIEVLITLTVLAILLTLGLPAYKDWIQNTQIRTAAESVLNGLQLARGEAVKRNALMTFTLSGNSWTVTVTGTGETIQSRNAGEGTRNAVITTTPAGVTSVTFNGMGRISGGSNVTFNVANPVAGGACQTDGGPMRCMNIVVQAGGQTRLCDPKLPATEPRGC
jgi:type IV fimbrial biogenesis protein FimT